MPVVCPRFTLGVWWPMTQPTNAKICRHCNEPFFPDLRNRHRQHFCYKPGCRKARKLQSQQLWVAKNPDYFKGSANVARVQQWRETHPGYSRRQGGPVTKPSLSASPSDAPQPGVPLQDRVPALQDSITRNPLIIGLIAHLFGCTLQDDIEDQMRRLIMVGMKIHDETGTRKPCPSVDSRPEQVLPLPSNSIVGSRTADAPNASV